ncbi:galactosyltransferase-related protein [Ornithinimicrobium sp. F0845]|uniref:glycosyltransferase family 2 protein n=1 Tax=Ornithinimicrobium sp. F0845 TaxID=2926412 RepID=UPI001FF609B5|nr:galactosyltransferase-related protein [Ornithinimicrobium sp. F0845]MCK0113618.1 galactosyltransferase-related protein [Ornithinimicrobium sp. F0845]
MTARTAVVTIAHGRHEHLAGLLWGLRGQVRAPAVFVAVAMDDPEVASVVDRCRPPEAQVLVPSLPSTPEGLPLAAARNTGASAAIAAGADLLVFLDVDCIPSPGLVRQYAEVLAPADPTPRHTGDRPTVAAGEVAYLPAVGHPRDYRGADLAAMARPHPARPRLAPDEVRPADDLRLFWSLSFALRADDWEALGGFDEGYVGYGAEDTDFGQRLGAAHGRLLWVGGATAYHQHHPSPSPPLQHLASIVDNANRFQRRWGWFPMEGWLEQFQELGLAEQDPRGGEWRALTHAIR